MRAALNYLCSNVVAKLVKKRVTVKSLKLINTHYLVPLPDNLPSTLRHPAISTWEHPFNIYASMDLSSNSIRLRLTCRCCPTAIATSCPPPTPLLHFLHLKFPSRCGNEITSEAPVQALQWTTQVHIIEDVEALGPQIELANVPDVVSIPHIERQSMPSLPG